MSQLASASINPCGCQSLPFTFHSITYAVGSPLQCCGKCSMASETQQIIKEKLKERQPFAVGCECSCHAPQISQTL